MNYKISAVNLLFSQTIIVIFLGCAYFIWYPYAFYQLNGVSESAKMLLFVNVCLGPLLILITYKKNKPLLKLDLYILGSIQLAAFIIGSYSIYNKHPVYVVFSVDRFSLINVSNATPEKARYDEFNTSFFSSPKFAFAQLPKDSKKRNELLMGVLFEGKADVDQHAEYYEPFSQHINTILARKLDISAALFNESSRNKLHKFIKKQGGIREDYLFFPLETANRKDVILVFLKATIQPVGIIEIDPWSVNNKAKKIHAT